MSERTLVFLRRDSERHILLAMKKRGFGEGKWNGVGGKIKSTETLEEAAVREASEEIDVTIAAEYLMKVGIIDFYFENKEEFNQRVHIYATDKWEGTPQESEEMRPKWYAYEALPFDEMWIDDRHWLPRVLRGEKIIGKFVFDATGTAIRHMEITTVEHF